MKANRFSTHLRASRLALAALVLSTAATAQRPLGSTAASGPLPPGHPAPGAAGEGALPPGHPSTGAAGEGALPPGHPSTGEDDALPPGHPSTGALPPGHPSTDEDEDDPHGGQGADPHAGVVADDGHGHGAGAGVQGRELPTSNAVDDPAVPVGSIVIHVVDPSGAPVPRAEVTLGIIHNSVAQGESRKRVTGTTDDKGLASFTNLETGSGIAYRAMLLKDGATFSAPPFQLGAKSGVQAILVSFPVVRSVEEGLIVSQSMFYTEIKDDRLQVQQAFKIFNFGRTAWVPQELIVPLPPNHTAFATQQGMTDVGVDDVPGKGVKLRGTFPPGQHVVEFRWQLPYSGESEISFDVGMTPHMAAARVIAPASKDMRLDVAGFPPPQSTTDNQGQRALVTERQIRREDTPLTSVNIALRGLPTEGPGKIVATLLAFGGIAIGLVLGSKKQVARDPRTERAHLLGEVEALEKAHAAGDVGPKTYERARRALLDEIARTFADEAASAKKTRRKA